MIGTKSAELTLIDTHCHLDFPQYDGSHEALLARAEEAGVRGCITIGTRPSSWDRLQSLVEAYPQVWGAVGLHPLDIHNISSPEVLQERLIPFLTHSKIKAIGETGLDAFKEEGKRTLEAQKDFFRAHLDLAVQYHLPVSIHSRHAEKETLEVLAPYKGRLKGVLHCFTGSLSFALAGIEMGLGVSFSGVLCFHNAQDLQEVARRLPLSSLLLETDSPFLCPERGRVNEPCYVRTIAEKLASLRGCSVEEVARVTTQNAVSLFSLC